MTVRPLRVTEVAPTPLRVVSARRFLRPQLGIWVVYTMVAVAAFFALIYSRTALDQTAFELRDLNQQIAVETELQQQLRLESARLASPSQILPAAQEMGLVLPQEVIPIGAEGVLIQTDFDPISQLAGSQADR